jgi:hypothetical protein
MTIDNKNILASPQGEVEEGVINETEEQQHQDEIEGQEEDSIAEDFLEGVRELERHELVSCSEDELANPDTGDCEEIYPQSVVVVNEICNNQTDDDLDGDIDLTDRDCLPVLTNDTDSDTDIQELTMALSPPSTLPISPGPDNLSSSEGEAVEEGVINRTEDQQQQQQQLQQDQIEGQDHSIAEDFLGGVPSAVILQDHQLRSDK